MHILQVRVTSQEDGQNGSSLDSLHPTTARHRERERGVSGNGAYSSHGMPASSHQMQGSSTARQAKNATASQLYPAASAVMAGYSAGSSEQQLGAAGSGSKSSPYAQRQPPTQLPSTAATTQLAAARHKPVVPSLNLAKHEGLGFGSGGTLDTRLARGRWRHQQSKAALQAASSACDLLAQGFAVGIAITAAGTLRLGRPRPAEAG